MRVLPSLILYLFMALCVLANDDDFVLGEKKENDRLVYRRVYNKFPTFLNPAPTVKIFARTLRRNEVISHIKLRNVGNKQVTFTVLKGEIGKRFVLLRAEAKFGEILSISMEVYASAAPTTTCPTIVEIITGASDDDVTVNTDAPGGNNTTVTDTPSSNTTAIIDAP